MSRIPMIDLKAQYATLRDEMRTSIDRVLASQRFILGDEGRAFESELAARLGCKHVIGVSSGTDALLAALMALDLREGDEVITTPFTFVATVEAIVRAGGRPMFVDLAADSFHVSCDAIESALTPRTRAVIAVHLFGSCASLAPLADVLSARDIALVEDAAQAIGATRDGKLAGTVGSFGAFSFFPSKNLGAYGDAGAVVTNRDDLADAIRQIRNHGQIAKYTTVRMGGNFRLDELQAAVLRVKLPRLDAWSARRCVIASRYTEYLSGVGDIALPRVADGELHTFHQFVIRTARRDLLRDFLAGRGIATEIHYPVPMHRQPAWRAEGEFPEADRASREVLSIPAYAELTDEMVEEVAAGIRCFFHEQSD